MHAAVIWIVDTSWRSHPEWTLFRVLWRL